MDTAVLTDEIKKANNPGFTDFGSGSIVPLASQCLRVRRARTPCTICLDLCPVDAIAFGSDGQPRITSACLRCAACIGACPAHAIGCSTHNIQYFKREALNATLKVNHLAVTCERTLGLLRLESKTDAPEKALRSLKLIEESKSSNHLLVMPCLAMIPKEMWFSTLSEIGTLRFKALSIFLPAGQCETCPVNAKDNIEDLFCAAIGTAEEWTGQGVGIIFEADDLPSHRMKSVREYLTGGSQMDRRGAFTGFLGEFKKNWEENVAIDNPALEEARILRERKDGLRRTLLSANIKLNKPVHQSSTITTPHYAFIETLGRHADEAWKVHSLASATDGSRCTYCGTCAKACPVRARFLYDTSVDTDAASAALIKDAREKFENRAQLSNAHLGETRLGETRLGEMHLDEARLNETRLSETRLLIVNKMYCIACSACIQTCPSEACFFTEISGSDFLVKVPEVASQDVPEVQL